MADQLLIYGAYGYTGALIARTAVDEGLSPILAGRRAEPVERQATTLDCDHRVFSLDYPEVIERQIEDVPVVLNCAGPFSQTAAPLIEACIRTGTDYLDLDGEVDVLEATAERDRDAERAGVTLFPGVGFDVVPTDCLAAYLSAELPSATRLTLAMDGLGTFSPGTLKSIAEGLGDPDAVRKDGEISDVPTAWKRRRMDFGEGPKTAITVPWGDVSTAYYSTGIPDIEVYATVPDFAADLIERGRSLIPLLGFEPIQEGLKRLVDVVVSGPTADERARSVTRIWGEVEDDEGTRVTARLVTPDTYDVTAHTAVEIAKRTLAGDVGDGFQTPASAFGPDFALSFEGVEREAVSEGEESVRVRD